MMDYNAPSAQTQYGVIEPQLAEYLQSHEKPLIDWKNLDSLRKHRRTAEEDKSKQSPKLGTTESVQRIQMRDGYQSEVIITSPPDSHAQPRPLVALVHGGGWAISSNLQQIPYARTISATFGAVVVTLSYRLAPEHPFPVSHNDVYDSVLWLGSNAASVGADTSAGWILGGVSAGGSMTTVTAQKMVSNGVSPVLTGMWVCVPNILHESIVPEKYKPAWVSREQNADSPVLRTVDLEYLDTLIKQDSTSPDWSPLNAKDAHKGLPPAYFQVCGMDPLRDDGLIYECLLREHGVKTKLDVYTGVPHIFFAVFPFLESAKQANIDTIRGFAWLLGAPEDAADAGAKMMVGPGGG